MTTRPFVINREVRMTEPDPQILDDLKTVLESIEMSDYDEFPNVQATLYRIMARYDTFPVFLDETYHEQYGGSSQ